MMQLELPLERDDDMSPKVTITPVGSCLLERPSGDVTLTESEVEAIVREHMMTKIRAQVENHLKTVIADKLQKAFSKE